MPKLKPTTELEEKIKRNAAIAAQKLDINLINRVAEDPMFIPTAAQRARISELAGITPPAEAFAGTKAELAKCLGISRVTLDKYWHRKGAPRPSADGLHSVANWRQFLRDQDSPVGTNTDDLIRELRVQREMNEAEEAAIELAKKKAELLPRAWFQTGFGRFLELCRQWADGQADPVRASFYDFARGVNTKELAEAAASTGEVDPTR